MAESAFDRINVTLYLIDNLDAGDVRLDSLLKSGRELFNNRLDNGYRAKSKDFDSLPYGSDFGFHGSSLDDEIADGQKVIVWNGYVSFPKGYIGSKGGIDKVKEIVEESLIDSLREWYINSELK